MERGEFRKRDIDVNDIINVPLNKPAQIPLPSHRSRSPCSAIRVLAVVRDRDNGVELKARCLDQMVVRRRIRIPCGAQNYVYASEEIGYTPGFYEFATNKHRQ